MAEWRACVGYEGLYEVSSDGRVRSVRTGLERKLTLNWRGYWKVGLSKGGKQREWFVHRLVAFAFGIPNPDALPQINHIDRDKNNNAVSNLEWVDNVTNNRHSHCAFLAINNPKQQRKLSADDVTEIRRLMTERVPPRVIAERYNIHRATVSKINRNTSRKFDPSAAAHVPVEGRNPYILAPRPAAERDAKIVARMREPGATIEIVAAEFGLRTDRIIAVLKTQAERAREPAAPWEVNSAQSAPNQSGEKNDG